MEYEGEELNYRYDTQLLIEGKGLDEDKIRVIEYQNYRALFGDKENPIKFIKKEDSNIYAEQDN